MFVRGRVCVDGSDSNRRHALLRENANEKDDEVEMMLISDLKVMKCFVMEGVRHK